MELTVQDKGLLSRIHSQLIARSTFVLWRLRHTIQNLPNGYLLFTHNISGKFCKPLHCSWIYPDKSRRFM